MGLVDRIWFGRGSVGAPQVVSILSRGWVSRALGEPLPNPRERMLMVAVPTRSVTVLQVIWVALRLTRRAGLKLWSVEGAGLVRLILSSARKRPGPSSAVRGRPHVLQITRRLAETKKGRERIAAVLDISSIDAWMVQENLRRAVEEIGEQKARRSW